MRVRVYKFASVCVHAYVYVCVFLQEQFNGGDEFLMLNATSHHQIWSSMLPHGTIYVYMDEPCHDGWKFLVKIKWRIHQEGKTTQMNIKMDTMRYAILSYMTHLYIIWNLIMAQAAFHGLRCYYYYFSSFFRFYIYLSIDHIILCIQCGWSVGRSVSDNWDYMFPWCLYWLRSGNIIGMCERNTNIWCYYRIECALKIEIITIDLAAGVLNSSLQTWNCRFSQHNFHFLKWIEKQNNNSWSYWVLVRMQANKEEEKKFRLTNYRHWFKII